MHGAYRVVLSCALTVLAVLCYDGAELASRGVVAPYMAYTCGIYAVALQISAEFPGLMSLTVPVVLVNRFSSDCPSLNDFT